MYLILEEGSAFISNCTETSETREFEREYTSFEFKIPIWMRDVSSGVKSPKFMIPPKPCNSMTNVIEFRGRDGDTMSPVAPTEIDVDPSKLYGPRLLQYGGKGDGGGGDGGGDGGGGGGNGDGDAGGEGGGGEEGGEAGGSGDAGVKSGGAGDGLTFGQKGGRDGDGKTRGQIGGCEGGDGGELGGAAGTAGADGGRTMHKTRTTSTGFGKTMQDESSPLTQFSCEKRESSLEIEVHAASSYRTAYEFPSPHVQIPI